MHELLNMTTYSQQLVESMINRAKLQRSKIIPVSAFLDTGSEPNLGPFPQYNIIIEDEPIEDVIESMERPPRRHVKTAPLVDTLQKTLSTSQENLRRLKAALEGPQIVGGTSSIFGSSSFYQENSQFVEDNVVPFQEVTIHPESAVPPGGDAPVPTFARPAFKVLDLNRTRDQLTMKAMLVEETRLLKKLQQVDAAIRRNKLDL